MFKNMKDNIVRGLMAGLCLLWIVSGFIMMESSVIMGIMMIGNGLCFGFFAFFCRSKSRLLKWLLYIFVVVNIISTFTDQMGLIDWIVLVTYILLMIFMIIENTKGNTSE